MADTIRLVEMDSDFRMWPSLPAELFAWTVRLREEHAPILAEDREYWTKVDVSIAGFEWQDRLSDFTSALIFFPSTDDPST